MSKEVKTLKALQRAVTEAESQLSCAKSATRNYTQRCIDFVNKRLVAAKLDSGDVPHCFYDSDGYKEPQVLIRFKSKPRESGLMMDFSMFCAFFAVGLEGDEGE